MMNPKYSRLNWQLLLLVCPLLLIDTAKADQPLELDKVRLSIEKSLPYLNEKGEYWINNKKCVSCHRVEMLLWSFQEADQRGFSIDQQKLVEWTEWTVDKLLEKDEKEIISGSKNIDGVSKVLLGQSDTSVLEQATVNQFTSLILDSQKPNGSWNPNGQLPSQKRPKDETTQVSTMWNLLALQSNSIDTDKFKQAIEKCNQFLKASSEIKSVEWYAVRLLLAIETKDVQKISLAQTELLALQQENGGWGWLVKDEADALATGLSLYTLKQAGVKNDHEAIQTAIQFLTSTQNENGSWSVKGTKEKKKTKVQETSTYWGTGWATVGLLQTLPNSKKTVSSAIQLK